MSIQLLVMAHVVNRVFGHFSIKQRCTPLMIGTAVYFNMTHYYLHFNGVFCIMLLMWYDFVFSIAVCVCLYF